MAMIAYKDTYVNGGVAEELYKAKKFAELDKHIAELDKVEKKRQGDPADAILKCRVQMAMNLTNNPKNNLKQEAIEFFGQAVRNGLEKGYVA